MMKSRLILFLIFTSGVLNGQSFKNTFKYNLSNPIIFGTENFILGFEWVINPHQSVVVNVGFNRLPSLHPKSFETENGRLSLINSKDNGGGHISFEYRFYLKSENKYPAPRGIYMAPYYSFNSFSKNNNWDMKTLLFNGNLNTEFKLNIHTLGAEMGYQFVISDRFTTDITFLGLGIGNFNLKEASSSSLNLNDRKYLFEKVRSIIEEKVPGYNLAVNSQSIENTGDINKNRLNIRFLINLGYRF